VHEDGLDLVSTRKLKSPLDRLSVFAGHLGHRVEGTSHLRSSGEPAPKRERKAGDVLGLSELPVEPEPHLADAVRGLVVKQSGESVLREVIS
jgi:hypothetical protein